MNDQTEIHISEQNFTDRDIFLKIWTTPRAIFKFINDNQYDKYVIVLLVLVGISRAIDKASLKDLGDSFSIFGVLGVSIIVGGLLGWISYYIYAALVAWTGRWLKGNGDTQSILRVLAYAMIPAVVGLLCLIPQIGFYGNEIFKSDGDLSGGGHFQNILVFGSMTVEMILGVWSFILCIIGVSEVQKFSIGKAILNFFLPLFIIIVPVALIVLLFKVS